MYIFIFLSVFYFVKIYIMCVEKYKDAIMIFIV